MVTFAPLTPELRARLSTSAARAFLRRRAPAPADEAIQATLASAPNRKAVARAAKRLRRAQGVVDVSTLREGSAVTMACVDSYVTEVSRARPGCAEGPRAFQSIALAYRTTLVTYWKRYETQRHTMCVTYFDAHAVARFIERGPFDPRRLNVDDLVLSLGNAHTVLRSCLVLVEAAERDGRIDSNLAATFPVPCATGGLWVAEPSTSGNESCDVTVVTYVGASLLSPEQNAFVTACGDGDFVGAIKDYPGAIRRTRTLRDDSRSLARVAASIRAVG